MSFAMDNYLWLIIFDIIYKSCVACMIFEKGQSNLFVDNFCHTIVNLDFGQLSSTHSKSPTITGSFRYHSCVLNGSRTSAVPSTEAQTYQDFHSFVLTHSDANAFKRSCALAFLLSCTNCLLSY